MGGGTATVTLSGVLESMTTVFTTIIGLFTNVISTITGNPLLLVPVLLAILFTLVFFVVKVIRKLGVRGVHSRS